MFILNKVFMTRNMNNMGFHLISNKQSLGFQNIKLVSANLDDKYNYEDCNGIIT